AGFEHLQPAMFALCAVAAWHAALTRQPAALLAALAATAVAAIFSGAHVSPGARMAAAVLFATARGAAALPAFPPTEPPGRGRDVAELVGTRLMAVAAGGAIYAAIGAGLRAEVVLTVAIAAAVGGAAWRMRDATPAPASLRPPLSSGSSTPSNTVR